MASAMPKKTLWEAGLQPLRCIVDPQRLKPQFWRPVVGTVETVPFQHHRIFATASKLLAAVMAIAACVAALAQTPAYHLGRTPTDEELRNFDVSIAPDGKGLPPGRGTAKEGAQIFKQKCARCHGASGKETGLMRENTPEAVRFRPFATTIWDSINRTMPPAVEDTPVKGSLPLLDKNNIAGAARKGPLSADEVYALTSYLLFTRGLVQENDVMDATSLPKVQMPNRKNFVPQDPTDWKPGLDPGGMRHIRPKK